MCGSLWNNRLLSSSPLDGVDDLVVGVGLRQLDPLGVVAAHEEAVGQGAEEVLEQRGSHEDGALGEVDVLGVVQPLAELAHGARVRRPPEDAHRRRALRHYLEQHRLKRVGRGLTLRIHSERRGNIDWNLPWFATFR